MRRSRGYLSSDINYLVKQIMTGEVQIREGTKLTPRALGKILVEVEGLDPEDCPSTGAITAILRKWEAIGYATFEETPFRFIDFTSEGRLKGLEDLTEEYAELIKSLPLNYKELHYQRQLKHRESQLAYRAASLAEKAKMLDELAGNREPAPELPF